MAPISRNQWNGAAIVLLLIGLLIGCDNKGLPSPTRPPRRVRRSARSANASDVTGRSRT